MNCEDIGTIRGYLDGELSAEDHDQVLQHLASCTQCRETIERLEVTEAVVTKAFVSLERLQAMEQISEARAFARVRTRLETNNSGKRSFGFWRLSMLKEVFSFKYRLVAAGLASLLVLVLIAMTPQGQVAASNFLAQFRAQKLQVVSVDPREMNKIMEDLSHFGTVDASQLKAQSLSPASSIAEASQKVGFSVKQPKTLPTGVSSEPMIAVKPESTLSFTFNVKMAQDYLNSIGQGSFKVPSKFDGAKLNLHLPSAVIISYGQNSSRPLVVGQSGAPSGEITGNVTPLEMRDFLFGLPGLSAETVSQLRSMNDWMNTLPIPLPKDQANWREVDLGGVKALVVGDNTGMGGFVIWQQDGLIYGVGGQYAEQELLTVAKSLR